MKRASADRLVTDLEAAAITIDLLTEELDRRAENWRELRRWIGQRWAAHRMLGGRIRLLRAIMAKMDAIEAKGQIAPLLEAIGLPIDELLAGGEQVAEERSRREEEPEELIPGEPGDSSDTGGPDEDRPW